jgi:DNA helicase-2/ATP-dependent DNA helicase PcrA
VFPKADELTTPWRWKKAGNEPLSEWLISVRREIENGNALALSVCPSCVTNVTVPTEERLKQNAIATACLAALKGAINQERIVVLSAAAVEKTRAALAKRLASWGFSNIEPINCKALTCAASTIDQSSGIERFKALLDFARECMTKTEKSELEKAIESHRSGGRRGKTKFQTLLPLADHVIKTGSADSMTKFLEMLSERGKCHTYRREMLYTMYSALRITDSNRGLSLVDAVADVQIRLRHIGRRFGKCSVGSTLLIKGLEFDHSVICHDEKMSCKDWYVALTRATRTVRILAPSTPKIPAAQAKTQGSPAQESFVFPI